METTHINISIKNLDKLNLFMVVRFRLEPIFTTAPATSKNCASFKRGQN